MSLLHPSRAWALISILQGSHHHDGVTCYKSRYPAPPGQGPRDALCPLELQAQEQTGSKSNNAGHLVTASSPVLMESLEPHLLSLPVTSPTAAGTEAYRGHPTHEVREQGFECRQPGSKIQGIDWLACGFPQKLPSLVSLLTKWGPLAREIQRESVRPAPHGQCWQRSGEDAVFVGMCLQVRSGENHTMVAAATGPAGGYGPGAARGPGASFSTGEA